jgi:hypothetical protein
MAEWLDEFWRKLDAGDVGAIMLLAIIGVVLNDITRR